MAVEIFKKESLAKFISSLKKIWAATVDFYLSERFVAVAYFPFIGWILPLYLKKDDDFMQQNAKLGLSLAGMVLLIDTVLLLIDFFMPARFIIVSFILILVIYAVLIIYFIILTYCIFKSLRKIFPRIFIFSGYSQKLEI